MDLHALLEPVLEIAQAARHEVLKIYHSTDFGIENKEDDSPLTNADRKSHELITESLQRLTPHIPVISEENADHSDPGEIRSTYCWVVDPLDGTKEFVARNGQFTINIALLKGQYPVFGVVDVPEEQAVYWALNDAGAWRRDHQGQTKLEGGDLSSTLRVVCSRSHLNSKTQDYLKKLPQHRLVPMGGSMKFLLIAEGKADLYPRLGPTMEWDTCAPQIIVEESGGVLINLETGKRMEYRKQGFLNPHFIVHSRQGIEVI